MRLEALAHPVSEEARSERNEASFPLPVASLGDQLDVPADNLSAVTIKIETRGQETTISETRIAAEGAGTTSRQRNAGKVFPLKVAAYGRTVLITAASQFLPVDLSLSHDQPLF